MTVIQALLSIALAGMAACTPSFVLPDGPLEQPAPAPPSDERVAAAETGHSLQSDFDAALARLAAADGEERRNAMKTLVELGPTALPLVDRALANVGDSSLQLDLLHLHTRLTALKEAAEPAVAPSAKEGQSPDVPAAPSDFGLHALYEPGDYNGTEVERFVYHRYMIAQRAFDAGQSEQTIRLCEALLILVPESRYRRHIQSLLLRAQTRGQTDVLAGKLSFDRKAAQFAGVGNAGLAQALKVDFFLKNIGQRRIVVDLGSGAADSILVFRLSATEYDAHGGTLTTEQRVPRRLNGERITLEPDEAYRLSVPVTEISAVSGGKPGVLVRLSVAAELRPASLSVENDKNAPPMSVFRPVEFAGAEIPVFPADFPLAKALPNPKSEVKAALERGENNSLFMYAPLLRREDHREVLELLLGDDLKNQPQRAAKGRMLLAGELTGKDFKMDSAAWAAWWAENRLRY